MPKLFVATSSPRIAGQDGTLTITVTEDVRTIGKLIHDAASSGLLVSTITYQDTCDVLAVLAGLTGVHRYNRNKDRPNLTLRDGDKWLIVTKINDNKPSSSLGAFDFEYTLCEFAKAQS